VSSSTADPSTANNSATTTTTVGTGGSGANLSVTKSDSPDPVAAGGNLTYSLTVRNSGPLAASAASLSDVVPTNTTFVSLTAAAGWTCSTPPVGGTGTVSCANPSMADDASASFTLVVNVNAATPNGTIITNTASVSSSTADPSTANNSATTTTTVGLSPAACTIVGTNGPDTLTGTSGNDVICGRNGADTINGGGGNDIILGGNGSDVLNGQDGNDGVRGGNGKDQITGGTGLDVLMGDNGKDHLNGQDAAGGDVLIGGLGKDTCPVDSGDMEDCP
jgi:uncharacterized repeat protein (TIGR01451 family)